MIDLSMISKYGKASMICSLFGSWSPPIFERTVVLALSHTPRSTPTPKPHVIAIPIASSQSHPTTKLSQP